MTTKGWILWGAVAGFLGVIVIGFLAGVTFSAWSAAAITTIFSVAAGVIGPVQPQHKRKRRSKLPDMVA